MEVFDCELFEQAEAELNEASELREYMPSEEIPYGAMTAASSISGNDVFQHGYEK